MKYPKISIITPSFNQGQYIEQMILSILEQDYKNVEFIIIDGASTDTTIDIIKKYEKNISYWVSEKDYGQAHAINKGLEKSTGDIFNWINSDDYLEPGALSSIVKSFNDNPGKKVICGYTHCFFEGSGKTSHTYRMGIRKTVAETIMNVEMNQPGSFYSIDVIRSLKGVNQSLRYVFDDELWFRFLSKYGLQAVGFTDKLIAHFRLHENSKSVNEGFFEFYKELLNIHLFIAKSVMLPDSIIQYLENEQYISTYQSGSWDVVFPEKKLWYKIFADKYKFRLYKDRQYKQARAGLVHSIMNKNKQSLSSRLLLGAKLAMPVSMIEIIRKQKNRKR